MFFQPRSSQTVRPVALGRALDPLNYCVGEAGRGGRGDERIVQSELRRESFGGCFNPELQLFGQADIPFSAPSKAPSRIPR